MGKNKVVLAYSGGLDTSVILKWLQDRFDEVITFTADIGQEDELEMARQRALDLGIKPHNIFIDDLREEFVRDYVFKMFRANAIYEGEYLLGTSIARPLIAKKLVEIAHKTGAGTISHGATGKGNDQIRFELGVYALDSNIKIMAPWRVWELNSREKLLQYANEHGIITSKDNKKTTYSMDANLLHISYEGGILEDPNTTPDESMWRLTTSLEKTPNEPDIIDIEFKNGDGIKINGETLAPHIFWDKLNKLAGKHGIGRLDIVENRFIGMKSRGCYETPGGTIYLKAHRAIESLCLDKDGAHLKDSIMSKYAELIYNGLWFSPERRALQALIDSLQENVNGVVKVKLFKGNVIILGRTSPNSLYSPQYSTFEADSVYNQKDAEGFIKLNALRFIIAKHSNLDS